MKIKIIKYFLILLFLFSSCSTKKNTFLTRSYHNLTARYNILFNGTESYKEGIQKLEESYEYDFDEILPVFLGDDEEKASIASSNMDRTIKKGEKLVGMHSITVKPEIKSNRPLSKRKREFLSKKEYNKWVDDNYLYIGKAFFYRLEYDKAVETFRFIMNEYKNEKSVPEAKIWLAKTYKAQGDFTSSEDILKDIVPKFELKRKLLDDYYATYADFYIKQENYTEAIQYLKKALDYVSKKRTKIRYTFILAQLNERTKRLRSASELYGKVIKMNPPYEFTFNAKINRALAYEKGFGAVKDIEKQLKKMLRDDKNIEYQDQIYYALGNLAFKEGNASKAILQYKQSLAKSTTNLQQKTKTYLTLADIYYDMPDYINAQAYYDSAVSGMDMSYPNYDLLYAKSKSLTDLVKEINMVKLQDSVQYLTTLSESERLAIIDKIIEKIYEKEEQEKKAELERRQNEQLGREMEMRSQMGIKDGTSSGWYFYNETAKTLGQKEFKLLWGNRPLEDNWRRRNKRSLSITEILELDEGDATDTIGAKEVGKEYDVKSREYYLKDIPVNDSMMKISHRKIENSLFNMGIIYKNELQDYPKAIDAFKELDSRYPDSDKLLSAYYNIYAIYKLNGNIALSETYKSKIIGEYPDSKIAKMLSNPDYIKEVEAEENRIKNYYNETYRMYNQKQFNQVITRANYALENYNEDELIPKFDYLKTLAIGSTQDMEIFRKNLVDITLKYPNHEVAEGAQDIIAYLDKFKPEIKEEEEKIIADKLFEYDEKDNYYFAFIHSGDINLNQLLFNIINFNLDFFDDLNLQVENIELDNTQYMVIVKIFNEYKISKRYYDIILSEPGVFKDVDKNKFKPVVISVTNFKILQNDKSVDRYLKFFKNYR